MSPSGLDTGDVPTVTVVIPTYDRPEMAERAVRSALTQTPRPTVVLVDDCGPYPMTDGVRAMAAAGEIILVRERNRGTAGARNLGAAQATSDYLLFLDDDDLLVPGALEGLLTARAANTEAVIVAGGGRRIFKDGRIGQMEWPNLVRGDFEELIGINPFFTAAMLVRREDFLAVNGFEEKVRLAEDWDLWLRLSRRARIAEARVHVVDYHVHGQNLSLSSRVPDMAVTTAEHYYRGFTPEERDRHGPALANYIAALYTNDLAWSARVALRRGKFRDGLRDLKILMRLFRLGLRYPLSRRSLRQQIRAHLATRKKKS